MTVSCVYASQIISPYQYLTAWLASIQHACLKDKQNYKDTYLKYSDCVSLATSECITDMRQSHQQYIIILNSFCGFIRGSNIIYKHTQWQIQGLKVIRIKFTDFSLDHVCSNEYLSVEGVNDFLLFCGKRKPWERLVSGNYIKLTLFLTKLRPKHKYFSISYHKMPAFHHYYVELKLEMDIKKDILLYLNRDMEYTLHIIVDSVLAQVELLKSPQCPNVDIWCFDGPGFLAPELYSETKIDGKISVTSSYHQMMCYLINNLCRMITLNYRRVNLTNLEVRRSRSFTSIFGLPLIGYIDIRSFIMENRDRLKSVHINRFSFHDDDVLVAGVDCIYGGMFFLDDEFKTIWSQCTEIKWTDDPLPSFIIRRNQRIICVLIFYKGYSSENIDFYVKIKFHSLPSMKSHRTPIEASAKHPNVTYFERKLYIPQHLGHHYELYPDLSSNSVSLNDYRFMFDVPSTISLSFVAYKHTVQCAVCSIYYRQGTSYYFPLLKEIKNISYAYDIQELQVTELRVNTYKCREKAFVQYDHYWNLLIEIISGYQYFLKDQKPFNESFYLNFNQSLMETIDLDTLHSSYHSGFQVDLKKYSFQLPLFHDMLIFSLAYIKWWNVIYIETGHNRSIWRMEQQAEGVITEMYLEIHNDELAISSTYNWNSAMIQFSGCRKFNIILYATVTDVSAIKDKEYYFTLALEPYTAKMNSPKVYDSETNPFTFHENRSDIPLINSYLIMNQKRAKNGR